jgi:hypothetical protein
VDEPPAETSSPGKTPAILAMHAIEKMFILTIDSSSIPKIEHAYNV